jgi:hypothetical protein
MHSIIPDIGLRNCYVHWQTCYVLFSRKLTFHINHLFQLHSHTGKGSLILLSLQQLVHGATDKKSIFKDLKRHRSFLHYIKKTFDMKHVRSHATSKKKNIMFILTTGHFAILFNESRVIVARQDLTSYSSCFWLAFC